MEKGCFICGICEAGKDESGVLFCVCKGYVRYVVWGVRSLPEARGAKRKIAEIDVLRKIIDLPASARLADLVDALNADLKARGQSVDERTVQRKIASCVKMLKLDPSYWGFEGLQAAVKDKGKPRRFHSSNYRKQLR